MLLCSEVKGKVAESGKLLPACWGDQFLLGNSGLLLLVQLRAGRAAVLHSGRFGSRSRGRGVVGANQLANVGLWQRRTVDVRRPLLSGPGRRRVRTRVPLGVSGWRRAGGGGVGGVLERQRALPGAEVRIGQGRVQREQVSRRGQDLGPLGVREDGIVWFVWKRAEAEQNLAAELNSLGRHPYKQGDF